MPFEPITDEAYETGIARGHERLARATIARSIRYDAETDRIELSLDAMTISILRKAVREFEPLSAEEMAGLRLSAIGDAMAVAVYDVHVDIAGLLADLLPEGVIAKAFGKRGGMTVSEAKSRASRANGTKGGRPRRLAG
jgi:hypothetical protein